jgi:hypothetical protein
MVQRINCRVAFLDVDCRAAKAVRTNKGAYSMHIHRENDRENEE